MQAAKSHLIQRIAFLTQNRLPSTRNPWSLPLRMPLPLPLFLLLLLLLLPSPSMAQTIYTSGVINGSLRVLNVLSVSTEQSLDFGRIVQNSTREISADDPLAGRILITKADNQGITIQVTYPSGLMNGSNSLSMMSNANSAKYLATGSSTSVYFNPSGYTSPAGILPTTPYLFVYFGGILSPTSATVPGIYSGSIIVSVSYSGI
jgi:spore coat protein U-like protein